MLSIMDKEIQRLRAERDRLLKRLKNRLNEFADERGMERIECLRLSDN
ncbi:hypothetical protein HQ545_02360 [Candidatus Woesearchaeota archaeon]|nr:hypothetical protein [Candidatus Woesearchaeota archaeon]